MAVDSISINKTNYLKLRNNFNPSFRATAPIPNDSVEISGKTDKKEKSKNWIAWVLGGIGATAVAIWGLRKGYTKHLEKLYNTKLVKVQLPENIEFKEAKTVDEGIKFAKDVLKIKEVDSDFSLEAINTINKGLVDVSNCNKGSLYMPSALRYGTEGDAIASIKSNIKSEHFGELTVSKEFFNHEKLNENIKKTFV